mgnify:CR=1 FL=1
MSRKVVSLEEARTADRDRVLTGILDGWGVAGAERAALLGEGEDLRDHLERVSLLLTIHRATLTMYPMSRAAADTWVHAANPYLEGRSPLEVMLEPGLSGLRRIAEHVNSSSPWGT